MEDAHDGHAYDAIGAGYASMRRPDPRIAAQIEAALGGAASVCNVGAGAGSYEPEARNVHAVEPSLTMIHQRRSRGNVTRGRAEALPFADGAFEAAMAVLTVHWWDAPRGLAELCRVAPRRVLITFDPDLQGSLWLVRDYLPELVQDWGQALSIDAISAALGGARVETVPVPADCTDGFLAAYWRRPERYLDPAVRASISALALLPAAVIEPALVRLASDLESGAWADRNRSILSRDAMDFGYRLIISESE